MHKIIQLREAEDEILAEERRLKKEEKMSGPLIYAIPSLMEYSIFSPEDIPRLKAYIRSTRGFGEVLQKAAKKGFPLYFQRFKSSFTNGEIYDILNNTEKNNMKNKPLLHCLHYNQTIHPALCIARNIIYPKKVPLSPYYLEAEANLKKAFDKQEKKRLRRELKKYDPLFDPYPKCRSCIMGKKLIYQSCLGTEFDPEDQECLECPSKRECCQLMRLRIESILEGNEDEVKDDLLKQWKEQSQTRKEVRKEMAKSKRKAEEVTEEVIEQTEAPEKKKKRSREKDAGETKTKSELRAERRKARKAAEAEKEVEEEKTPKSKKKEKKKGKVKDSVEKLLAELQEAKDDGDQDGARKIRAALRAEGYSLRNSK